MRLVNVVAKKKWRVQDDEEDEQYIEPLTHTFVLKLWLTDQQEQAGKREWHGHLDHAATGKRTYFSNFPQLNSQLYGYLDQLGVQLPLWWRVYKWLKP